MIASNGSWRYANFYFFYFTTVGILVPYWSLHLKHLGFTATEIGQLVAILGFTKVVAPNIWAAIADHITLRRGNSLGILKLATGMSLVIFCFMFVINPEQGSTAAIAASEVQGLTAFWPLNPFWPLNSFWTVALISFGFSVFWNSCMPQMEAATLNHLAGQRFRYGNIRLWGSVGFIVTVLGLGYVMDVTGPSAIMPLAAASFALMFMASFLLKGEPNSAAHKDSSKIALSKLLNRKVILILVLCTLMQASHAPFYTFYSIYLESYGYSKTHIGWLWAVGVIFEVLVFMAGYRLLRQYQLTTLLSLTFLIAGVRWCLVAMFPESPTLMFFCQILHAITYGLYHSVMIQLIDQFFQGRYQVRGQALYSSVSFGIGGAAGSAISGVIWTAYGSNVLFAVAGLLMLLAAVISYLTLSPRTEQLPIREL